MDLVFGVKLQLIKNDFQDIFYTENVNFATIRVNPNHFTFSKGGFLISETINCELVLELYLNSWIDPFFFV